MAEAYTMPHCVQLDLPVPPLPTPRVPVTPGVILAVPSNDAVEVDARFVRIVFALVSLFAAEAVPVRVPVTVRVGTVNAPVSVPPESGI